MSRFFSFFLLILRIEAKNKYFILQERFLLGGKLLISRACQYQTNPRRILRDKEKKKKTYINELQMELSTSNTSRKRSS